MLPAIPAPRLNRDRAITLAGLLGIVLLAWAYLFHDASQMASMDMAGAAMSDSQTPFDVVSFAMMFLMWSIMMVAMMLPSAAPAIMMHTNLARKHRDAGSTISPTWIFTLGYVAVWTGFSLLATALQFGLQDATLVSPMLRSQSATLSGLLLLLAGIYQWLPLKDACLKKCRAPLQFFMFHWRDGNRGALHMGAVHGSFCLGCCWALMLLLFVAGVMNLAWVAILAVFVLVEKLIPGGEMFGRVFGLVMIGLGAGLLSGLYSL